jgi:hypothetical protein
MQQGLTIVDDFNEAQLRGINLRKLSHERFTSKKHLSMMTEHETKSALIWQQVREKSRPVERRKRKSDTPKVQPNVEISTKPDRNVSRQYRFTPEQIRIAEAVAKRENEKN